jgi:hypothetical protein
MPYLFDALCDLAELALGCQSCKTRPPSDVAPDEARLGGLVYLTGDQLALHVGVVATPADCRVLAGRLLGKGGANLSRLEVKGAMCELAYLLAGGVRRRLSSSGTITVGHPSLLEGRLEPWPGWLVRTTEVEVDGTQASLIALTQADAANAFGVG